MLLYDAVLTTTPTAALNERDSPWLQTVYRLFMEENGSIPLPQVGPEMKYLCRKGCPGREAHWLDSQSPSRYLISVENSVLYVTCLVVTILM